MSGAYSNVCDGDQILHHMVGSENTVATCMLRAGTGTAQSSILSARSSDVSNIFTIGYASLAPAVLSSVSANDCVTDATGGLINCPRLVILHIPHACTYCVHLNCPRLVICLYLFQLVAPCRHLRTTCVFVCYCCCSAFVVFSLYFQLPLFSSLLLFFFRLPPTSLPHYLPISVIALFLCCLVAFLSSLPLYLFLLHPYLPPTYKRDCIHLFVFVLFFVLFPKNSRTVVLTLCEHTHICTPHTCTRTRIHSRNGITDVFVRLMSFLLFFVCVYMMWCVCFVSCVLSINTKFVSILMCTKVYHSIV